MKTLKTIAVTFLLTAFLSHTSFAKPSGNPDKELRTAVTNLLKNPQLNTPVNEQIRITFFITNENKLVVLKTDAQNVEVDQFIKTRLNYKHLEINDLDVNRIVHIKVRFKA